MTSQLFSKFLYLLTLSSLMIGCGKRYSKTQGDYIYYQVDSLADSSFSYDGIIKLENSLIDSIKIDAIVKNKISANKLGDFFLESNYMKVDSSSITYIYYNFTRQKPDGDGQDHEKIARTILFSENSQNNSLQYGIETEFMEGMCCHSISPILKTTRTDMKIQVVSGRTKRYTTQDTWSYTDTDLTFTIPLKHNLPINSNFIKARALWDSI